MTTVSFFTASPPSLLVFSGRRTMQTHSDDECLGPHGVASVGLSSLAHDLYSLEITSQRDSHEMSVSVPEKSRDVMHKSYMEVTRVVLMCA
ncbi:hypothetical protein Bca4012_100298 [Brassica carinata]|uniref:Uncharacterized protein n=1 Tax=Brassica carinata TaxID=52824 RepID=A0A8X7TSB0_BRACI|nr:hypothetical protein Bca52824_082841 [Brassica carinata]